ncbi:mediator of RNA polymerase II transcription subunit 7 [Hyphopichia burtonii NRRL Y-1933]|uniref:Mediator of RNA polymerase II transcription subunit 7 n=1 Tax=Hyphopichia burtonii NRRL Y-1933 TaxID=984485 RepID=A0A1E4RN74_9ASCO|nr:mediator of RNA polymerase II transcription subunit 7 [Hyphopichia burtonii NRRL Y-1933]ODV68686.1 mediator of RNA polymerase II transcription subunit 7 [Hyphopichia burtonii NRRL Y-1933]
MSEDLISSLYPPPPPYFKFFTQENLNKVNSWKKEQDQEESSPEDPRKVPEGELQFLIPPEQPSGTHYRGYGNLWSFEDKLPSLKEAGWTQLYKEEDELITSQTKIKELHKLMDSLLLNFLELIGSMSVDPSKFHYKIEDLKLLLININHILNTYRPHQTRESLIMLLKKQIDKKNNEINEIDKVSTSITEKIQKLTNNVKGTNEDVDESNESSSAELKKKLLDKLLYQST